MPAQARRWRGQPGEPERADVERDEWEEFQSVSTAIRTVADIRRMGTYRSARALAVRGTPDQIGLAAWLVGELEQPAGQNPSSNEHRLWTNADPRGEVVVRVFHATYAVAPPDLDKLAAGIRNTADIRRISTYKAARAIIVRSTAEQIALGEWLFQQLDQPAVGQPGAPMSQSFSEYEYFAPYDRYNIVRVFYLPQFATTEDFQEFATRVAMTADLREVFTYNAPRALVVRGAIDQVEVAERMIKGLGAPQRNW
jgi:hypothetical protein